MGGKVTLVLLAAGVVALAVLFAIPKDATAAGVLGWNVDCGYAGDAPYDPIAARGGKSHMHSFDGVRLGNRDTRETMMRKPNSCRFGGGLAGQPSADDSSYWQPKAYRGTTGITHQKLVAYYRVAPGVDPRKVRPWPVGLKIIAGDKDATRRQSLRVLRWTCGKVSGNSTGRVLDRPVNCSGAFPQVQLLVSFPDCSDGRHDSVDHRSHMAYSRAGRCPSTHPTHVPMLVQSVRYDTSKGADLRLSSGAHFTMHADWMDGWPAGEVERRVRQCINDRSGCVG